MRAATAEELFVAEIARDVWTPVEELTVSQWAERYRELYGKTSSRPGKWDNAYTPYLVGIMDAFTDPLVNQITFMKSSQVGGTEVINNILGYVIDMAPAPTIMVYPDADFARDICNERVKPMVENTKRLLARLAGESTDGMSAACLKFDQMDLHFVGGISKTKLRSRPIQVQIVDDADLVPSSSIEEARQRGTTFPNKKLVVVGTPGDAGAGIDAEYVQSDRRFYAVPCPHCLAYQELVWERVRWSGGSHADKKNVRANTWYECASCREKIDHSQKRWMIDRGVWVAEGEGVKVQRESPRSQLETSTVVETKIFTDMYGGEYRVNVTEGRRDAHAGFRISALYSPFVTWGQVAEGYVAAKGMPLPEWWNGQLGRPWKVKSDRVEIAQLRALILPHDKGGYGVGHVPERALFLTTAIDVQHDRIWFQVDWWGEELSESGMVDCGWIASVENDKLAAVDALLRRSWPVLGRDGERWRSLASCIDSGDGRRTMEVYECVRRNRKPYGLRAVKGEGTSTSAKPYNWSDLAEVGVRLLLVRNVFWKDVILASHRGVEAIADLESIAGGETMGITGTRVLPHGTPPEYFEHYTSEERVFKGGKPAYQSRTKGMDGKNNHLLDCGKYNRCLVEAIGCREYGKNHRKQLAAASRVAVDAAATVNTTATNTTRASVPPMRMATAREMREAIRS